MKSILKLSFIAAIAILSLTVSLLVAQAAPTESPRNFNDVSVEIHTTIGAMSSITVAPVISIYLPAIQRNSSPFKIGLVTDIGGINDKGFNETTWTGLQNARTDFGVGIAFLESHQSADYEQNIDAFIQQDYDLIMTVGFLLGDATQLKAESNPNAHFAIVDVNYVTATNIMQSQFAVDEAAFLAGYLAAGVSKTGKVGTFGGINIPPIVQYMVGFEQGVVYYNQVHSTTVNELGWSTDKRDGLFIGNFDSTDDGYRVAIALFDEGVDVVFPVAGPAGIGSAVASHARNRMMIGSDQDWYYSVPAYKDVFLTSALKHVDRFSYEATRSIVVGTFAGGVFNLNLSNNGVGLAGYHDHAGEVSPELQAELDQLKQHLIDGTITTCWAEYQNSQPCH